MVVGTCLCYWFVSLVSIFDLSGAWFTSLCSWFLFLTLRGFSHIKTIDVLFCDYYCLFVLLLLLINRFLLVWRIILLNITTYWKGRCRNEEWTHKRKKITLLYHHNILKTKVQNWRTKTREDEKLEKKETRERKERFILIKVVMLQQRKKKKYIQT